MSLSFRCVFVAAALLIPFLSAGRAQLVSVDPSALPLAGAVRSELAESIQADDWLAVESHLFRRVRNDPASAALRKALAAAHFRNERYLAAASEYARADRLEPLDPGSRFALATAYVALDRRHWARRELEALAAEFPRNPLYPHWLAGIYQHYQWFDRAIAEAERAISLNPAYAAAHDRLGQCLEALGRTEEALASYAEAERLARAGDDPSPWPSYHRGSLLRDGGRFDEALAPLERAVALDPKNAEARHELGLTLDRLGRPADALATLEAAAALDPDNPKIHYALSRLQRQAGDLAAARSSLERFERLSRSAR